MVDSVSAYTPYSYLDQLTGKTAAATAPVVPAADNSTDTSDAATASTAAALGLSPTVVALLQNVGGDSTVSALLGGGDNNSPVNSLLGDSTTASASSLLANLDSGFLQTEASSGLYEAALNGAAHKSVSTATAEDYMSRALAAYNAVVSQRADNNIDTTG